MLVNVIDLMSEGKLLFYFWTDQLNRDFSFFWSWPLFDFLLWSEPLRSTRSELVLDKMTQRIWSEKVQQTPMNQETVKNEATLKLSDKTKSFLSCAHYELHYFRLSYLWCVSCFMLVFEKLMKKSQVQSVDINQDCYLCKNIYFSII